MAADIPVSSYATSSAHWDRLECPVFLALARSSDRTRELLESQKCVIYEQENARSLQWDFRLHAKGALFGIATVLRYPDSKLRLNQLDTNKAKYHAPACPGAGSILMLAAVAVLLRLGYRELSWYSTSGARDFYLYGFFRNFEAILEEWNLRMEADKKNNFRLYR